ncbi:MAG: hypothetical protein CMN68_01815 [Sphingomonadaceae bacterium]|nr:hypothetical protein [Sphingomonadaceae bacterium]
MNVDPEIVQIGSGLNFHTIDQHELTFFLTFSKNDAPSGKACSCTGFARWQIGYHWKRHGLAYSFTRTPDYYLKSVLCADQRSKRTIAAIRIIDRRFIKLDCNLRNHDTLQKIGVFLVIGSPVMKEPEPIFTG